MRAWCEDFRADLEPDTIHQRAIERNGEAGFGRTEAEVLHCFVRSVRPKKVVQVGCGVSTAVVLNAADTAGHKVEVVCVEPYPTKFLKAEHDGGRIRLVKEMAQKVALEELTSLAPGDLLFIDSTHTVRLGSEVPRLILEVLPRLPVGAFVHFHDIHFPYDFPPGSLDKELFFQRESAMLHAFLCLNRSYRIATSLAMLHHAAADRVRQFIPHYAPAELRDGLLVKAGERPSSIYLGRVA